MNIKKAVRILGNALMIVALGYLVRQLYVYRSGLRDAFSGRVFVTIVISSVICAAFVLLAALFYNRIVGVITGKRLQYSLVGPIYAKSNLYKYLPGNVVHFIGRNQIALMSDASHSQVAICTLTEVGFSAISAFLAAIILSFRYVMRWISENITFSAVLMVSVVISIVAILLVVFFKRSIMAFWQRICYVFSKRNLVVMSTAMVYYVINQMINGLMFVVLLWVMNIRIPLEYMTTVAGVYSFAWLVGFIVPGSPGGLGIREAMLALLLNNIVNADSIAAAVLMNRLVTVLGDALAYPFVLILCRYINRDRDKEEE